MALRLFHPCQFFFSSQNIRVESQTLSGGVALSGVQDVIRNDGGGYWTATFSDADIGERNASGRAETMAWRAVVAGMLGGAVPVIVAFCDRLHQPFAVTQPVPHRDTAPFSDDSLYQGGGGSATVLGVVNGQTGGNRATILDISVIGGDLIGAERFTHVHPEWGERAYEVYSVEPIAGGTRITFQPPIRGGIKPGDALDFDNVRCRMRLVAQPDTSLTDGAFTTIQSIGFREDMTPPVTA